MWSKRQLRYQQRHEQKASFELSASTQLSVWPHGGVEVVSKALQMTAERGRLSDISLLTVRLIASRENGSHISDSLQIVFRFWCALVKAC